MKKGSILILMFWATNVLGQNTNSQVTGITLNLKKEGQADTTIKVYYTKEESSAQQLACFVNGRFMPITLLEDLNPNIVEDTHFEKEPVSVNGVDYYGKLLIKTKVPYEPKAITLNGLKDKYVKPNALSTLFMIDGIIVKGDYDNYWIKEDDVLSIIVDQFKNPKENIDLRLIKILTKSGENIKKANEIKIR